MNTIDFEIRQPKEFKSLEERDQNYKKVMKPEVMEGYKLRYHLLKLYSCVYRGSINTNSINEEDILEELFEMFNINHPEDFEGHSMSVGDIVIIERKNVWFCDSIGWKKIGEKEVIEVEE